MERGQREADHKAEMIIAHFCAPTPTRGTHSMQRSKAHLAAQAQSSAERGDLVAGATL